jgi:adenosylhomocysteine nucleosidase
MFEFLWPARRRFDRAHLPILVITGMQREAACIAAEGVTALCSGANATRLRATLAQFATQEFGAVVSFGLAGGLDPALRPGDCVVADRIVAADAFFPAHPGLATALTEMARTAVRGAVAGVDAPVMDGAAKAALAAASGAQVVDMESHIAADFARRRKIPFGALRVVSDPATRALPALAARAITPTGEIDSPYVARALLRDPGQIVGLMRAGLDSRAAFDTLGRVGPVLGPQLRLVLAGL